LKGWRWRAQLWTFKCIQSFRFLQPKIMDHPFYQSVVAAGKSAHANQIFMVRGPLLRPPCFPMTPDAQDPGCRPSWCVVPCCGGLSPHAMTHRTQAADRPRPAEPSCRLIGTARRGCTPPKPRPTATRRPVTARTLPADLHE